jgi:putative DNA primase/helicase
VNSCQQFDVRIHNGIEPSRNCRGYREDALDTVIALRRTEDYSPEQGARFEIHFEKLRNRIDGSDALSFEAMIETFATDRREGIRWSCCDLKPPLLMQAAELFTEGMTVRKVATALRISKSEAGRLRLRAFQDGLLTPDGSAELNYQPLIQ